MPGFVFYADISADTPPNSSPAPRAANNTTSSEDRTMANTAQAKKRARQSADQNAHNSSLRSAFRTAIKAVRKAIAAGDKATAAEQFRKSTGIIDRIADKKIIHKNKAARHKSRLAAAVKALNA